MRQLLRIRNNGSKELIALPVLDQERSRACQPERIKLRPPDDIWVIATCGNAKTAEAALFRLDHSQRPLVAE